jgi:protein-S-isoprenylcysteine O-methyltransferase Ste14
VISPSWLLEHLTLLRLALFLASFAGCIGLTHWLQPRGRMVGAAIMAVWSQVSVGVVLDVLIVRAGMWEYRPMPFSLGGVPLDLHADWGLTWGYALVAVYSRLRSRWRASRAPVLFVAGWSAATLAFDAVIAPHMPFFAELAPGWWLADGALMLTLTAVALAVYHTILWPPRNRNAAAWACRSRSVLYVSSLAYVFYAYLPAVVLSLTDGGDARPLLGLGDWRILVVALAPPVALGAWATLAFTDDGLGTPLPLDPPRRLVVSGPYAYVRNPMQIAGVLLAVVVLLRYPTLYLLAYAMDMLLVSIVLFHLYESHELPRRFGEEYARYSRQVRNWIPRLSRYEGVAV